MERETLVKPITTLSKRPTILHRALEVCLLLIVAATALAFPLCLSETDISAVYERLSGRVFQQLYPWISCGYSPLVLKESVLLTLAATLLFLFCWIKIRSQWLGQEASVLANGSPDLVNLLLKPEVCVFAVILYFAVTVAWSPVFQHSLHTWIMITAGLAVMLVVRSQATPRAFAIKCMVLVVACGSVLAVVALLQHLNKMPFLARVDDPRNRMSSLIGHNTGLSSWLMFPLSFVLYFLITNRRMWVQGISAVLAVLFVTVIIAAESRAIWILGLLICIVIPWKLLRLRRRRITLSMVLSAVAILLAVVLAFSISPQTNPLARLPVSLAERVSDHILNLDQLRRETRLRILVVSLSELFPQSPLFGSGLGSFSWEYPQAQGNYFTSHPDTWLGTTMRRTDLAHNDYLQVLIETGLIGLMLVLVCGGALARESLRHLRSMDSPYDRALWWALAVPTTAVAVHALVDFPFHVAPIAIVTLVSAALTTRIMPPVQTADTVDTKPARKSRRDATLIALAASLVIFAWFPWAWQALVGRVMVSDSYYNAGMMWLGEYQASMGQTVPHRLAMLERARRSFREAVINNVFNGQAYEGQATACVNRASLGLEEYRKLNSSDAATTAAEGIRMGITRDAESAINLTDNQLRAGGLRYHFTYYLLGRAWRMLWELEKDSTAPEDSRAYKKAVDSLRTALEYNPADSTSLLELSDLLSQSQKTAAEGRLLLDRLFELDPWSADELLLQPALELAAAGEIPTAHAMLDPVFESHPDHPRVLLARAWLAFYEAVWPPQALDVIGREEEYLQWRREHLEPGWESLKRLVETAWFMPRKERLVMLYTAASGDLKEANALAKARLDENIWDREARSIYYWTEHEMYGGGRKYEATPEYSRTNALLTIYFMTDRKQGVSLGALAFQEELTLPEARRLAAFCEANEWWGLLRLGLAQVRKTLPGDPVLNRLAIELEQRSTTTETIEAEPATTLTVTGGALRR